MRYDYYKMMRSDLRGLIAKHILVFGSHDHLSCFLDAMGKYSGPDTLVCFVSDEKHDERITNLQATHQGLVYLECCTTNREEIKRTAIEQCQHVVFLTDCLPDATFQDFKIVPVIRIVEQDFPEVKMTM